MSFATIVAVLFEKPKMTIAEIKIIGSDDVIFLCLILYPDTLLDKLIIKTAGNTQSRNNRDKMVERYKSYLIEKNNERNNP